MSRARALQAIAKSLGKAMKRKVPDISKTARGLKASRRGKRIQIYGLKRVKRFDVQQATRDVDMRRALLGGADSRSARIAESRAETLLRRGLAPSTLNPGEAGTRAYMKSRRLRTRNPKVVSTKGRKRSVGVRKRRS